MAWGAYWDCWQASDGENGDDNRDSITHNTQAAGLGINKNSRGHANPSSVGMDGTGRTLLDMTSHDNLGRAMATTQRPSETLPSHSAVNSHCAESAHIAESTTYAAFGRTTTTVCATDSHSQHVEGRTLSAFACNKNRVWRRDCTMLAESQTAMSQAPTTRKHPGKAIQPSPVNRECNYRVAEAEVMAALRRSSTGHKSTASVTSRPIPLATPVPQAVIYADSHGTVDAVMDGEPFVLGAGMLLATRDTDGSWFITAAGKSGKYASTVAQAMALLRQTDEANQAIGEM